MGSRESGSITGNFFTASYDCQKEDKSTTNKDEYKGILGTEFNLVWHALKKAEKNQTHAQYFSNDEMEELMSLSGTLISTPAGDGSVKLTHKTSLIKDEKMIENLIYGSEGGKIRQYKCINHDKCLDIKLEEKNFTRDDSYLYKIRKLISSIAQKLIEEQAGSGVTLSAEEKYLAQTSSIAIIKIIKLESAMKGNKDSVVLGVEEYAEMIAFDYLINFLDSMLDQVYKAVASLEYNQIEGEQIKNFKEEIRFIKGFLFAERHGAFERMSTLLSVKQRIMQVEHMVNSAFAEFRAN
jgi:hypothetical protein